VHLHVHGDLILAKVERPIEMTMSRSQARVTLCLTISTAT
jgi:hypothetical protein